MKRNLLFVMALVAMYLNGFGQALPTAKTTEIHKTNLDITVDGYNDDELWGKAEELGFDYSFQSATLGGLTPDDMDATVQLAWKEGLGICVFLSVTDNGDFFLEEGGTTYQRDNAEFFFYWGIDGDPDYGWGPAIEDGDVANDSLFSQIRLQLNDAFETVTDGNFCGGVKTVETLQDMGSATEGKMEAKAVANSPGWDLEVIFPFEMFFKKEDIMENLKFGFEITIGDADDGADRHYQLALTNDTDQDLAWNNKNYINTAVLAGLISNVEAYKAENDVKVYPTLVSNVLNLKGEVSNLSIYNTVGQVVMNIDDVNTNTIDVSALQSGIYFVDVDGQTTKIIKK